MIQKKVSEILSQQKQGNEMLSETLERIIKERDEYKTKYTSISTKLARLIAKYTKAKEVIPQ